MEAEIIAQAHWWFELLPIIDGVSVMNRDTHLFFWDTINNFWLTNKMLNLLFLKFTSQAVLSHDDYLVDKILKHGIKFLKISSMKQVCGL